MCAVLKWSSKENLHGVEYVYRACSFCAVRYSAVVSVEWLRRHVFYRSFMIKCLPLKMAQYASSSYSWKLIIWCTNAWRYKKDDSGRSWKRLTLRNARCFENSVNNKRGDCLCLFMAFWCIIADTICKNEQQTQQIYAILNAFDSSRHENSRKNVWKHSNEV